MPGLDADDARKVGQRQIDGMQAGDQRRTACFGIGNQQAHGAQRQVGIEGGNRLVGKDQIGLLVKHAGNSDALQLATGKLVAAGEQFVGEIDTLQRGARTADVERVDQRDERLPPRPLAEFASQHRRYNPLPTRNGR